MKDRLIPDDSRPGAFHVKFGHTNQSWVDPSRPEELAFEYVQHVALILEHTALTADPQLRLRVIHIGGAGMSLPRWVAHRRPGSAQIVLEPDSDLVREVRHKIPLPPRSGIKVRETDGRTGIKAMPAHYADVVIVDAFDGSQVPGELVTRQAFEQYSRIGRGQGLLILNVTDRAPFHWSRRVAAGLAEIGDHLLIGAEPAVLKGRRFGNLVLVCSRAYLPVPLLRRRANALPFGYRLLTGQDATAFHAGATPFTDDATVDSPEPSGSKLWFA